MSAHTLTNEWAKYDVIKKRQGANPQFMNLDARWEMNYLAEVISTMHPRLAMDNIKIAIYAYTQLAAKPQAAELTSNQPTNRDNIMKWVLKRLAVSENTFGG